MQDNLVWMTTRRIKPGTLADFARNWRPARRPDDMLHAHAYWSGDEQESIEVSSWVSRESCDTWRDSWEERAGVRRSLRTSSPSGRGSTSAGS